MTLYEFLIKCPDCKSVTTLVAYESNPLIFECRGCHKKVVIQGTSVYTVSSEYVTKVLSKCKTLPCGHVVTTTISDDANKIITEDKIKDLQKVLNKYKDVNDIIKNI